MKFMIFSLLMLAKFGCGQDCTTANDVTSCASSFLAVPNSTFQETQSFCGGSCPATIRDFFANCPDDNGVLTGINSVCGDVSEAECLDEFRILQSDCFNFNFSGPSRIPSFCEGDCQQRLQTFDSACPDFGLGNITQTCEGAECAAEFRTLQSCFDSNSSGIIPPFCEGECLQRLRSLESTCPDLGFGNLTQTCGNAECAAESRTLQSCFDSNFSGIIPPFCERECLQRLRSLESTCPDFGFGNLTRTCGSAECAAEFQTLQSCFDSSDDRSILPFCQGECPQRLMTLDSTCPDLGIGNITRDCGSAECAALLLPLQSECFGSQDSSDDDMSIPPYCQGECPQRLSTLDSTCPDLGLGGFAQSCDCAVGFQTIESECLLQPLPQDISDLDDVRISCGEDCPQRVRDFVSTCLEDLDEIASMVEEITSMCGGVSRVLAVPAFILTSIATSLLI